MPQGSHWLPSAGSLERELDHHFTSVQDLYDRVIHSPAGAGRCCEPRRRRANSGRAGRNFLPGICAGISNSVRRGSRHAIANSGIAASLTRENFESFLEKAVANPVWLDMLEGQDE